MTNKEKFRKRDAKKIIKQGWVLNKFRPNKEIVKGAKNEKRTLGMNKEIRRNSLLKKKKKTRKNVVKW